MTIGRKMRNYSIAFRIAVIMAIMILSGIVISGAQIWGLKRAIYAEREQKLHDMVGSVQKLIKLYDDEIKAGTLSSAQAQEAAKKAIRALRWGNGEYYGVYQFDGVTLVHAVAKNEGVNRMEVQDPNGMRIVAGLIAAAQNGGGLVRYMVPRGTSDPNQVPMSKLSYAAAYEPWKWVIQAGVYIDDIDDTLWRQFVWIGGSELAVLLIAGLLAMRVARSISRPVADLVAAMKGMADGDMTVEVPWRNRRDEVGVLANGMAEMEGHLHDLATQVRGNAGAVHGSALRIAESVEGQAVGSSQMSASVAEITATMEEFSASTALISEHSRSVVDIANVTYDNSWKGRQALELLTAKMGNIQDENQGSLTEIIRLGDASKEISKVMKIITTIADQTKLIAFNAALEAASAGETGRRFGVVAAEIRRLADSVTESTAEIEGKVGQIQDAISRLVITSERGAGSIGDATAAATNTATLLDEMVDAAKQTTTAAQQISLSTMQQKTAASQVLTALREIVDASSHGAASMGQLSDISRNMAGLSSDLDTLVDRFRLRPSSVAAS